MEGVEGLGGGAGGGGGGHQVPQSANKKRMRLNFRHALTHGISNEEAILSMSVIL